MEFFLSLSMDGVGLGVHCRRLSLVRVVLFFSLLGWERPMSNDVYKYELLEYG